MKPISPGGSFSTMELQRKNKMTPEERRELSESSESIVSEQKSTEKKVPILPPLPFKPQTVNLPATKLTPVRLAPLKLPPKKKNSDKNLSVSQYQDT